MLTTSQPRTLTRVPASLTAGKSLGQRVGILNAIAEPYRDFLVDPLTWALDWSVPGGEFRLETIPFEDEET